MAVQERESAAYSAIFHAAVLGSIAPRGQIAVKGADRAEYLQGLLTNDIPSLTPGTGCYAAWLTPQGRMLTDLHLFQSATMLLLDVPAELVEPTLKRLDEFLFSEDVQIASLAGSLASVSLHGPLASGLLERVLEEAGGLEGWAAYSHAPAIFDAQPVVVARVDQLGVPGYHVYLDPSQAVSLRTALLSAGAVEAPAAVLTAARIEAGYPLFGQDMTEDTIPLEAGIESRAISTSKGCYVGQEVIIRVLHRGHGRVARRLVGLQAGAAGIESGARIKASRDEGAKEIGFVTSAGDSPSRGRVALAYVHRDFVAPGTVVAVNTSDGLSAATVTALPMSASPPASSEG
jgi:folate-binding protein YgfZ